MPSEIWLHFPSAGQSRKVYPRQSLVAGISETCDLNLREFFSGELLPTVSRRHFKLFFIDGEGYAISDLYSRNGTKVNGIPLLPGEPWFLHSGDVVTLAAQ